jgi:putative transferase (TIGR04331 family)
MKANFFIKEITESVNKKHFLSEKLFIEKKYNIIIKILVIRLNKIHSLNENQNFWEKVLGSFLDYHIFQCSRFYLSKIKKKYVNISHLKNFIIPNNCYDYRNLVQYTKRGQETLYYLYLIFFKKNLKSQFIKPKILEKEYIFSILNNFKVFIHSFLYSVIKPKILVSGCFWKKKHKVLLLIKSFFSIQFLSFSTKSIKKNHLNLDLREEISKSFSNDKFINFFLSTLIYYFPKSLLEDFKSRLNYSCRFIENNNKLKYIVNESLDEDNLLLFALVKKSNGIKTVYSEHNFLQYFFLCNYLDRIFKKIKIDIFLSLGWQFEKKYLGKLSCTFIRSGSLYSFRIKKVNQTIECLYMSAIGLTTPFFPNGGSGHIGYKFSKLYIDNSFNFIKNLDKNFIKLISYKPYNKMFVGNTFYYNPKQLQIERWLKKKSATILKSDDDGNKLLSKSKFLITDYLSTSYLQGIASNIPTVVIHPDTYHFNSKYKKVFNNFYKLKIFHKDPFLAAEFVNKNFDNIDNWWNSKDVQEVIKDFLNNNLLSEKIHINNLLRLLR